METFSRRCEGAPLVNVGTLYADQFLLTMRTVMRGEEMVQLGGSPQEWWAVAKELETVRRYLAAT